MQDMSEWRSWRGVALLAWVSVTGFVSCSKPSDEQRSESVSVPITPDGKKPNSSAPDTSDKKKGETADVPVTPEGSKQTSSVSPSAPAVSDSAQKPASSSPTADDFAKIGAAYGTYVSESKKEGPESKIYRFSLNADSFTCNASNFEVERKTFPYFVVSTNSRGFTLGFDGVSASRTLTFAYDGSETLSLDEGKAPGECGWSLQSGSWERTEKAEGAAPTEIRPAAKASVASKESTSVQLGEDAIGPRGSIRVQSFSWTKKIGFSKAEPDEKFGQLRMEIRNGGDEPIDVELAYANCEDLVSFSCETGSESGSAFSCERPHFGDETPNGILAGGKKASFNCCRKFDDDAKGCHAKVDMRAVGGGIAKVNLGK